MNYLIDIKGFLQQAGISELSFLYGFPYVKGERLKEISYILLGFFEVS